ncbi:YcaQ family DNA glycosylase [Streptomyces sp. ISL-12]|uniref:DNA glycosylase AlkZ-like family protein n=1 Tax=Streptomyces sp. ISL-12 TaxID=2819177 RepID=UPI001BE72809|nr:crosslink repair DNA glycosylase YcaQ family protein [Streptomyces sp. ISL-12]MBT2411118.1 YcaQ family DNA glycosylase [Streptomyces sp. ISL-12]
MTAPVCLSPGEARRIAIAATLLDPGADSLDSLLERLRIIQLDSITTLARAHQLTLTARLPHLTAPQVDTLLQDGPQPLTFEYPAHAHALVPLGDWPLWAFRRRAARRRPEYPPPAERRRILALLGEHGPLPLRGLRPPNAPASAGWTWGPVKQAVEFMLWAGDLICVRRTTGWQRLFDLPERHLPAHLHTDALTDDACLTDLLGHAGRALGAATATDLADYLRIPARHAARLLPQTLLLPATVPGWTEPTWVHPDALHPPHPAPGQALLLGPFDNLIWNRPRTRRLFGFTHILEAYKPAHRRIYGYYVCPLLTDDRLTARADLTRTGHHLTVLRTLPEPDAPHDTPQRITQACHRLQKALGLQSTGPSGAGWARYSAAPQRDSGSVRAGSGEPAGRR